MGVRLIQAIAKQASDADGLSVEDRRKILARHGRRLGVRRVTRVLEKFKDLVITPLELHDLAGEFKRRLYRYNTWNHIIGVDGQQVLRNHLLSKLEYFRAHPEKVTLKAARKFLKKALPRTFRISKVPLYLGMLAYLKFNIKHSERIPNKELATIVSNHLLAPYGDPRPLAVIMQAKQDEAGALNWRLQPGETAALRKLTKTYFVRYYETTKDYELKRLFKEATKRRKASLFFLRCHGSRYSCQLGSGRSNSNRVDTVDWHLRSLRNRMLRGGHVVVNSCSNGKGGRAWNNINFLSRIFPTSFIHGMDAAGALNYVFNRKGLFVGIRPVHVLGPTNKAKTVVVRRHRRVFLTQGLRGKQLIFSHPRHRSTITLRARNKKLAKVARTHRHHYMRLAAMHALGKPVEEMWHTALPLPLLIAGLEVISAEPIVRGGNESYTRIVRRLATMKDPRVISALSNALFFGNADFKTEKMIASALTRLEGKQTRDRMLAVEASEKTGDRAVLPQLLSFYKGWKWAWTKVRMRAVDAIYKIGGVPELLKLLFKVGPYEGAREHVIKTLVRAKDPRTVQILSTMLHNSKRGLPLQERLKIISLMQSLRDPRAVRALLKVVAHDPAKYHRTLAWEIIQGFGRSAIPHVTASLKLPDAKVRNAAREILRTLRVK